MSPKGRTSNTENPFLSAVIKPLAWLRVYGVTEPEQIEAIRQRIIQAVYAEESALAKERLKKGAPILGAQRLQPGTHLRSHTPKRKERRIFMICGNEVVRPHFIAAHKDFADRHRQCYQKLKDGLPHEWPPGTFIPWAPPEASRPAYQPSIC